MPLNKKIILVTGAAGFIGSAVSEKLLSENNKVIGIDSINDYYNPLLKQKGLKILKKISKIIVGNFKG